MFGLKERRQTTAIILLFIPGRLYGVIAVYFIVQCSVKILINIII